MTAPDLHEVAAVYLAAASHGEPPTVAVGRHYGASRSTAGRWVRTARAAQLLEPVGPGRSPRLNRKVVAVATALGVDALDLRNAVLQHAHGDLRVH